MKLNGEPLVFAESAEALKEILIERKAKNSRYSARAFARDLGISQAFLSQVLSGKRNLSLELKLRIAESSGLSLQKKLANKKEAKQLSLIQATTEHEKILKFWYHLAILEMLSDTSRGAAFDQVRSRLPISDLEFTDALQRLQSFGYLTISQNRILKRTKTPLIFHSSGAVSGLRKLHESGFLLAQKELTRFRQTDLDHRTFQTIYVSTARDKIEQAKNMISEFNEKLLNHLTESDQNEVFQYSFQLFSIEKTPNPAPLKKA